MSVSFQRFMIGAMTNIVEPRGSSMDGDPSYERGKALAEQFRAGLESQDPVYLAGVKGGFQPFGGAPRSGVPLYNQGLDYGHRCWQEVERLKDFL